MRTRLAMSALALAGAAIVFLLLSRSPPPTARGLPSGEESARGPKGVESGVAAPSGASPPPETSWGDAASFYAESLATRAWESVEPFEIVHTVVGTREMECVNAPTAKRVVAHVERALAEGTVPENQRELYEYIIRRSGRMLEEPWYAECAER